jgi:cytoskeletal protein CcmA (bactofilin family)
VARQSFCLRQEDPRVMDEGRDGKGRANLGRSLIIKGEVTGSEDLTIDGRVEGRIHLEDHDLTIGQSSKVSAEVHAKNITIYGDVTGDMVADEKVTLADSGRLVGNIKAPRISVSDGAQFRGNVDMVGSASEKRAPKVLSAVPAGPPETAVHGGQGVRAGKLDQ